MQQYGKATSYEPTTEPEICPGGKQHSSGGRNTYMGIHSDGERDHKSTQETAVIQIMKHFHQAQCGELINTSI